MDLESARALTPQFALLNSINFLHEITIFNKVNRIHQYLSTIGAMFKVVSSAEARQVIRGNFGQLLTATQLLALDGLLGRYLAGNVLLTQDVPAFNRSTVDGYAVKSSDVFGCSDSIPAILVKTGEVLMGEAYAGTLNTGECVYVPTGGFVPDGADCMVMIENCEPLAGAEIAVYKAAAPGQNLIFKGEDGKTGDALLKAGKRLNAGDIGSLALLGLETAEVRQMPRVAIISTGDELVPVGQPLPAGKIYDVNAPLLKAMLRESGAEPSAAKIVADREDELYAALDQAANEADLILVSGGTSVGLRDALPTTMAALGEVLVHGIAVKPGKPTVIGKVKDRPAFGLPGNPVAAFFIYKHFVAPLLASMQGGSLDTQLIPGRLERAVASNHGREEFVLARYADGKITPVPSKSGLISTVAQANAYFIVPRDTEGYARGTQISVHPLEG